MKTVVSNPAADGHGLDLVVIGDVLEEIIRFPDREVGPVLGGPAAYAAVASSQMGLRTAILTHASASSHELVVPALAQSGVVLDGIRHTSVMRRTVLAYAPDGTKHVSYLSVPPSLRMSDLPDSFRSARAFLICPMDFEVTPAFIDLIKSLGSTVMLDLGGYGGTVATRHPVSDINARRRMERAVNGATIVKASDEDCRYLFGSTESPLDNLIRLQALGAEVAVLSMGASGVLVAAGGLSAPVKVDAFRVRTEDVTGAGDVFCGAFVSEFLRTGDPVASATYACAGAALLVRRTGGVTVKRIPCDVEVRTLIRASHRSTETSSLVSHLPSS